MVDLGWIRMTALLLLLAGSVGHVMQNGDAMAERWLGIRIGTGQPVVATREPRLIGYVGTFQTAALPGRDDAVARMDMAPPLLTELQPGLTGIAPEHGPLTE
jgi:hypothetical protein